MPVIAKTSTVFEIAAVCFFVILTVRHIANFAKLRPEMISLGFAVDMFNEVSFHMKLGSNSIVHYLFNSADMFGAMIGTNNGARHELKYNRFIYS